MAYLCISIRCKDQLALATCGLKASAMYLPQTGKCAATHSKKQTRGQGTCKYHFKKMNEGQNLPKVRAKLTFKIDDFVPKGQRLGIWKTSMKNLSQGSPQDNWDNRKCSITISSNEKENLSLLIAEMPHIDLCTSWRIYLTNSNTEGEVESQQHGGGDSCGIQVEKPIVTKDFLVYEFLLLFWTLLWPLFLQLLLWNKPRKDTNFETHRRMAN